MIELACSLWISLDIEEDDDDEKHLKELEAVTGRRSPHRCSAFHSAVFVYSCICVFVYLCV